MYCNGSNLDSTYSGSYNTMISNWFNNSDGYVATINSSSIMVQGQESWSKPQAHDRADLASMYE